MPKSKVSNAKLVTFELNFVFQGNIPIGNINKFEFFLSLNIKVFIVSIDILCLLSTIFFISESG